jgi:hypothetical protein
MKKFKSAMLLIVMAIVVVATSCKKDDNNEEPPIDPRPAITFKVDAGYTAADGDFMEEDEIKIGVVANQNLITKKKLTKFTLVRSIAGTDETVADENIDIETFNKDYTIELSVPGSYKFTAKITDEDNVSAETSFDLTVDEKPDPRVPVKKNSDLELGSVNDTLGSFYSTSHEQVYKIEEAAENQEKVDFIFWKDPRVKDNTITSPDNNLVGSVNYLGIHNWTVKNETRFIKTEMTTEEFEAIEDKYLFPEFDLEAAADIISNLEAGNILFFKTQEGKHGYIRIIDLYNTRGDRALIDVIVEE